jgi:Ca2+-binding RTX toxin-like protein
MKTKKKINRLRFGRLLAVAVLVPASAVLASSAGAAIHAKPVRKPAPAPFHRPTLKHRTLNVAGTRRSDRIALRLKARDHRILQVDVGDDGKADFSFKRKQVARIAVHAAAGNDVVRIDERNGVFTDRIVTLLDGGDGNDTLIGGTGAETLLGGAGTDLVDGNGGSDHVLLGAGDDTFVWDPGDGSDTVDGEAGTDTMGFNGAAVAEHFTVSANGTHVRFARDAGNVTMDLAGLERVDVHALGGPDLITVDDLRSTDLANLNLDLAGAPGGTAGDGQHDRVELNGTGANDAIAISGNASSVVVSGLRTTIAVQHQEPSDELVVRGLGGNDALSAPMLAAQAISLILDGGAGDDTIAGSAGVETLLGGDGNDTIDGNAGNDRAFMGAGDDTFVWDPGDGSDTIEGEAGADRMRFNGANVAEQVDVSANRNRLRFFRTQANITMDTAGVERVEFNALGGADLVTVNDLSGTDVTNVDVDLGGADGQSDRVVVNGTNGPDRIRVNQSATGLAVTGLEAQVTLHNQEPNDALVVKGLDGNDDIAAAALPAQAIALTLDGGAGDDELFGGLGNDMLLGGDGDDTMDGSKGNDVVLMGAGDDTFAWDPGDGSDVVEGGDGDDSMQFIGANIAEQIHVSANGNRVLFVRDVANVTMDLAGVEQIDFQALGGADLVDVGDLTGTDLTSLQVDLGGADGAIDRVAVAGTDGEDAITVNGDAGGVKVSGLHTGVELLGPEFPNDELDVDTGAGRDSVDSSQLAAGTIKLVVDGVPVP